MAPLRKKGGKGTSVPASRHVWNIGDLVLAKVKGHPWWPARVSEPDEFGHNKDGRKVFVYFFGTKQIGFVQPVDVKAFTSDTKKNLLAKAQIKSTITDFSRAVKEICEASKGLSGQTNDESQVLLNEGSVAANEESTEQEEVDEIKEKASTIAASEGSERDEDGLRGSALELQEREPQERETRSHARHLNNGMKARATVERVKGGMASYEPNKKRRRLLASEAEPDSKSLLPANAKNVLPPRRLSLRHGRILEASLPNSLANHIDVPNKMVIERDSPVGAETSLKYEIDDEMTCNGGQFTDCRADGVGKESLLQQNKNSVFEDTHLEASSFNSDDVKLRDTVHEASHDSPRGFPAYGKLGIEKLSETHDAREEAEDSIAQILLPKKKRRASRRLEKEVDTIASIKPEEQLHAASSPPKQSEVLPKSIPAEYQRRKRVSTGTHNQAQLDSQMAGNSFIQSSAIAQEETAAAALNSDFCDHYEASPSVGTELENLVSSSGLNSKELISEEGKQGDKDLAFARSRDPSESDVSLGVERVPDEVVENLLKMNLG